MKKMFYQNDFEDLPGVKSGGCLYMSLMDIVREDCKYDFKKDDICEIYNECNKRGFLGVWNDRDADGAYCWNHLGILNTACEIIEHDIRWEYTAKIYTKLMEEQGHRSFVNDSNYTNDDSIYMIFQVRTTKVSGHFKRFNYDPWKSGSREVCLKSTRYYKRVV